MSRITECERCNAPLTEQEIWAHGTPKWCEGCHRAVENTLEADLSGYDSLYLAGPINGCTDAEAKNWRDYVSERYYGRTYDPMVRDYRGRELEDGIAAEIVENDKADIDACDALLVMYEKPSVGTSMEVLYAWQTHKRVYIVDVSGRPLSPWLLYHSHGQFSSLDEAIAALNGEEVA